MKQKTQILTNYSVKLFGSFRVYTINQNLTTKTEILVEMHGLKMVYELSNTPLSLLDQTE